KKAPQIVRYQELLLKLSKSRLRQGLPLLPNEFPCAGRLFSCPVATNLPHQQLIFFVVLRIWNKMLLHFPRNRPSHTGRPAQSATSERRVGVMTTTRSCVVLVR